MQTPQVQGAPVSGLCGGTGLTPTPARQWRAETKSERDTEGPMECWPGCYKQGLPGGMVLVAPSWWCPWNGGRCPSTQGWHGAPGEQLETQSRGVTWLACPVSGKAEDVRRSTERHLARRGAPLAS